MSTGGLRELKKQRTRDALEQAAWQLFVERGYDETTIDDIAEAAEVAPRTFFRYFGSKEAVLFGGWLASIDEFKAMVLERPAEETPRQALEAALLSLSHWFDIEPERRLQRARMVEASPNAGSYYRQVIMPAWEDAFAEAIATRLAVDPDVDLRPRLWAGAAVAAIYAARAVWLAGESTLPLLALIEAAFDELANP